MVCVMIHSGSRGLGYQVCDDSLRDLRGVPAKYGIELPDRQLACAPVESPEGRHYLGTMCSAGNFAWCNRQLLMMQAREAMAATPVSDTCSDTPRTAVAVVEKECVADLTLEATGALVVPFGVGGTELLIRTIREVGITAISCTPSYPAVLEELTGLPVINAGVPGEVTAQGLSRLPGLLERHRPALVILCHGGNDMLRRESAEAIYSNLEAMVDLVRAHGAEVLLVGVPQPRLLFLQPAEIYDRLANDRHLVYLRDALPRLESDAGMKSDPIHLNREGYRQLGVEIHELLQAAGAVSDVN